jgi:ankyrin repeat protein
MNALSLAIHHNHKVVAAVLIRNKIKLFNGLSDCLKDKSPIFMALNSSDSDLIEIMHANNQLELEESKNSQGDTAIMVASKNNFHKITNFLSLRSEKLNQEDSSYTSLLLNLVLNSNFKMATIVISRGANVDYANSEA